MGLGVEAVVDGGMVGDEPLGLALWLEPLPSSPNRRLVSVRLSAPLDLILAGGGAAPPPPCIASHPSIRSESSHRSRVDSAPVSAGNPECRLVLVEIALHSRSVAKGELPVFGHYSWHQFLDWLKSTDP